MAEQCKKQVALYGNDAVVTVRMPGSWGRSGTKRLFGRWGPVGQIVAEEMDMVLVMFRASEVLNAVESGIRGSHGKR
jgi:hypothetical protein